MNTPVKGLVSIILPNRDHAHYLPASLDALLAQSWRELEILIVDDASSDNSKAVIEGYVARDARVRAIYLSEHSGVNRAVDAAMPHIRGEYLCTAAADDFTAPDFFAHSVALLDRFPAAGLCFSDPTEFHEAGQQSVHFPLYLSEQPAFFDPASLQRLIARNHFSISSNTVIYRTSAFRGAGGYHDELGWLSDWFVTAAVALRHGACYVPEALTFHRIRQDSLSATTLKDASAHRAPFDHFLSLLSRPDYADVAVAMQNAGVLPEYRLRTLRWLSESEEGRKFVGPRLAGQILYKSLWSLLRPLSPTWLRRKLRKASSQRAEKSIIGDRVTPAPLRAVFLDRDGVITANVERDGKPVAPTTLEQFRILPDAEESTRRLKAAGFAIIVVTNQPDITTGLQQQATLDLMHAELFRRLAIDDIKVCIHTDAANCACRKPKPGMLLEAAAERGIDLTASFMVGDRWRDIGAGQAVGCKTILIDCGYKQDGPCDPDKVVRSLSEAADFILERS